MENTSDHYNKENDISKGENPSRGNSSAVREASNVILLVSDSSKTGKYIQILWYLKHINSTVAIEASNKDESEIKIVEISARDGNEVHDDEQLLVTSNTLISYVVQSYRFVFVIDISPSTFVVDGTASCMPHSKIINRLRQCLEGLLVEGNFLPASKFSPEIFITICFYSPFIAFDEDRVILQGCSLTKKNVDSVLHYVQERFALFSNRLCWTMQPHLRRWNQERKKLRQRAGDLLPENFFRQQSYATDAFKDSMHGILTSQMAFRAGPADEGFINSEWSLMFMLRVGLLGLQLLPDTSQPNIVLITDAVCNVTDVHALQKLMNQLRNYSIACSFIQIQEDCNTDAVFGHFSSPEFFTFLAKGTSGAYIPDKYQATGDNVLDLIENRPFLCKNLQLSDTADNYLKDLIHQINPEFVEPHTCGVVRRKHYSMEYESCLEYFLRLRLYEGFILRDLKVLKKGEDRSILVELSLPWKPQVTIGYKICAPYEDHTKKLLEKDRMLIHVHSFNSLPDLFRLPPELLKEKSLFRYVMKENKAVLVIGTRELETLCSQNVTVANFVEFWRIISEFEERHWQNWSQVYTFRVILTHDHPLPPRLFLFEEPNVKVTSQLALTVFYDMLAQMTTFSLVHGQTYNLISFLPNRVILSFFASSDDGDIPKSFYIVKLTLETQLAVIKLIFLDGLTISFKDEVVKEFQGNFKLLSIERSCFFTKMLEFADAGGDCATLVETVRLPALTIINRPLEIMLARYKKIPLTLNRIIRLEKTNEANRDLILHNSLAKYFCCRRYIWYLKKAFPLSSVVSCTYADYILHTILQRRLNEGFHVVYGDNGIVTLVKHIDGMEQQLHCGSALLQYIIFPPTSIRPMRIIQEHLEKMPSLSKIVKIHGAEAKKSVSDANSALKSDLDLQLMTEMWSEPLAVIDPQYVTWSGTIQQQVSVSNNLRSSFLCRHILFIQFFSLI
uniref:Protein SZT2 n=1 Tax=Elaeophora elaphi TaxID=1147741 RepID=A0A0R3RUV8_9BILA